VRVKALLLLLALVMSAYGLMQWQNAQRQLKEERERTLQILELAQKITTLRGQDGGLETLLKRVGQIAPFEREQTSDGIRLRFKDLDQKRASKLLRKLFDGGALLKEVEIKKDQKGCELAVEVGR